MSGNRYIRHSARSSVEPKFGRMLLVSLGLHLLMLIVFSGGIAFKGERDQRPVYYVDLTQMPVSNPQAGRPDARPKEVKKPVAKPVEKVSVKQTPVEKAPVKPAVKPSKPQPEVVKPTVKPQSESVNRQINAASDAALQRKLAAMQREEEREELKRKLAALASGDSREEDNLKSDAPLGTPDGQGDEVGPEQFEWLKAFIKENWSLSEYMVPRTDVEATAWVIYNKEGRLVDFSLSDGSGVRVFDDSIKRAILKSGQLNFEPGFANQKITITFNLKDLLDR